MSSYQLEDRLKQHAKELFGQEKEPPAGHRERFEQRLKDFSLRVADDQSQTDGNNSKYDIAGSVTAKQSIITTRNRKIWIITTIAAAAVLVGFVFLLNPFAFEQQNPTLAEVRSFYSIQLEEKAEATRQLIQQVDEINREILLVNVDLIENDSLPDVQMPDDEYIVLIAGFYSYKIEILQNIQDLINETESFIY